MASFFVSGSAPRLYPVDTFFSLLLSSDGCDIEVPKRYPYQGEWGKPLSTYLPDSETPVPKILDMVYLSLVERRFYSVDAPLPQERMEELFSMSVSGEPLFDYIIVGMAPYGGVAVWLCGEKKEVLIKWIKGEEVHVKMEDFLPMTPKMTLDDNCDFYINNDSTVKNNIEQYGLPSIDLFDKYMQQFCYRYQVAFGKWNDGDEKWEEYGEDDVVPELDSLEEALFDGTHDKLNDGGLMRYHEAGKPKKLALHWHIDKKQFSAYFWFHDEGIKAVFERFYGPHPETKVDFIIRIDPDSNKFQLSMFRYGLQEPMVLPEDSYELIVFRNKFEAFRSDNYSQATGAWIW